MIARLAIAVVTFGTPLVLARILVPASYGTFKLAWLWCTTLGVVLPMGLTPSLIYFVPREPERRGYFIAHALLVTTALGLCAGTLLYFFGPGIAHRRAGRRRGGDRVPRGGLLGDGASRARPAHLARGPEAAARVRASLRARL